MKITTMENHLAEVVSTPRFSTTLVSVFAGLATVLAMMGIYGVMSYSVTRRKPEIGVRMALGADRGDVVRMVLYQALRLTGTGVLIGCLGAIAASRFLESQLFNVSRADPATYVAMLALVVAVAVLSSYLPAWRAAHVEPLEALREE
jgi:putative ABC transport system permease protein